MGRTKLKTSLSGAVFCVESAGDVQKFPAPRKSSVFAVFVTIFIDFCRFSKFLENFSITNSDRRAEVAAAAVAAAAAAAARGCRRGRAAAAENSLSFQ